MSDPLFRPQSLLDAFASAHRFLSRFLPSRIKRVKISKRGRTAPAMLATVTNAQGVLKSRNRWLRSVAGGYDGKRKLVEGKRGHHRFIAPQSDMEHAIK